MTKQAPRCNSITGQKNAFKVHQNDIEPAFTISKLGLIYFHAIINSRERATWNGMDIHKATQLARTECDIEDCYEIIDKEGWTVESRTQYGLTLKRHPVADQLERLQRAQQGLTAQLGLSASQRKIAGDKQARRNEKDAEIRETNKRVAKNKLLA